MTKFYTFAHKRPDFLQLQLDSFRKHVSGGFELIVFNNAAFDRDRTQHSDIARFCAVNSIQMIDIGHDHALVGRLHSHHGENVFNNEGHYTNTPIACAYSLCWAWTHVIGATLDKTCVIDSDMFFVRDENPTELLKAYDLIYAEQSRGPRGEVYYMWNGLVCMNLANLPEADSIDWWCGRCEGLPVDVGGQTFHWLRRHKNHVRIRPLTHQYVSSDPACTFSPVNYEYFGLNTERSVLHFRGGSGWHAPGEEYTAKKTAWLRSTLNDS